VTISKVDFDPFSEDYFNDPHETYRRLRDEAPVYYSEKYNFYALSRHRDVAAAFKDFETFSSADGITLADFQEDRPPQAPSIIMMDPPDHRQLRSLVNKVFTPRAIHAQEPLVRRLVSHYLSEADPARFDAVADFAALFPVEVITTMLGVPEEHHQNIRHWLDIQLTRVPGELGVSQAGLDAAIQTAMVYFGVIGDRRAQPRDDMISRLIATEVEREDGGSKTLDDIEIAGFATLLGGAGAETVTKLVGAAVVLFSRHPEQWAQLLADRSAIPAAVEEVLRYAAPAQYAMRSARRDVELHGTTIPAGSPVMLIEASANRDERAFTDADRFDINRDRSEAQNLGLGYGIHSCLGAALARMESAIAIEHLLDFMPDYEVDYDNLRRVNMTSVAGYSNVPVRVRR
jgi:cytochrome P450